MMGCFLLLWCCAAHNFALVHFWEIWPPGVNKEVFCTSWVFNPGLSLLGDGALAIFYLILLFWLFIGIQILSDIFMEAIEEITSKSQLIEIPDADGNLIQIEKQFWNPTIANLTLMALGSSAPEIIISLADTI